MKLVGQNMFLRQILRVHSISRHTLLQLKCEIHLCSVNLQEIQPAKARKYGYYEILGIPKSSRSIDIKSGYLKVVRQHHPDRAGPDNEESKAIFSVSFKKFRFLLVSA